MSTHQNSATLHCASRLELLSIPGLPLIEPGTDLLECVLSTLEAAEVSLQAGDVLCIASKVVARAENRFVNLAQIEASTKAQEVAAITGADARLTELILRESTAISRCVPKVLVVRHRLGFVCANAGIDASNTRPAGAHGDAWVLLLPEDPDRSAATLLAGLQAKTGVELAVIITDSFGRPFRLGSLGIAIGSAGLPVLFDQRGRQDLFGRRLEHTFTAVADQVAAAADLVAGQANEGRGLILVRGLRFAPSADRASELNRPPELDLYA